MRKKVTSGNLYKGPSIQGYVVHYNDEQRIIIVDGKLVSLTPTEYCLCRILFEHTRRVEQGTQTDLFVSFEELEKGSCLPRYLVLRHLQNANVKFQACTPLALACDGQFGYILVARPSIHRSRRQYQVQKSYMYAV